MSRKTRRPPFARWRIAPKSDKEEAEKTYALYMKTKKTIPRDGGVDVQGARRVAENWKEFGLQKMPPRWTA